MPSLKAIYIFITEPSSQRLFNSASSSTPVIPLYTPLVSHFSNALNIEFPVNMHLKFILELSRLERRYHYPIVPLTQ